MRRRWSAKVTPWSSLSRPLSSVQARLVNGLLSRFWRASWRRDGRPGPVSSSWRAGDGSDRDRPCGEMRGARIDFSLCTLRARICARIVCHMSDADAESHTFEIVIGTTSPYTIVTHRGTIESCKAEIAARFPGATTKLVGYTTHRIALDGKRVGSFQRVA